MSKVQEQLKGLYEVERLRIAALTGLDADLAHPVFGEGMLCPRLMLIGEAPGREEAEASYPFVGKAGKQLNALLEMAELRREELFVTNAVKYRPTRTGARSTANRTPSITEMRAGLPLLKMELELVAPAWVATLGNTPLRAVLAAAGERADTVGELHGRVKPIKCGQCVFNLFPLYHPASAIYNPALTAEMEADILRLAAELKRAPQANF